MYKRAQKHIVFSSLDECQYNAHEHAMQQTER